MADSQLRQGTDPAFSIGFLDGGDSVRILVRGELDIATVPQLNAALGSVEGNGHREIVLDLEALTFMDASGLSAILTSHRRSVAAGKAFTVTSCRGIVARVFRLTGQEALLDLRSSAPAAHD